MTMPRTLPEIVDDQDRIAAQFEAMGSNGESLDGGPHRDLLAAAQARSKAEQQVASAIERARASGYSWALIGSALGTSAQAAQQRYGAGSARSTRTALSAQGEVRKPQ